MTLIDDRADLLCMELMSSHAEFPSVLVNGLRSTAEESAQNWLRHSRRLDELWQPAGCDEIPAHLTCGAMAFAAIARMKPDRASTYFPELESRPWINRTVMERALKASGRQFERRHADWPGYGLCLVHFIGPWTERGYPMAILAQTHWVAVDGDYVYDVNWRGWLPRHNWEEIVLEELVSSKARATGWQVLTGYEVDEHLSPAEIQTWLRLAD